MDKMASSMMMRINTVSIFWHVVYCTRCTRYAYRTQPRHRRQETRAAEPFVSQQIFSQYIVSDFSRFPPSHHPNTFLLVKTFTRNDIRHCCTIPSFISTTYIDIWYDATTRFRAENFIDRRVIYSSSYNEPTTELGCH